MRKIIFSILIITAAVSSGGYITAMAMLGGFDSIHGSSPLPQLIISDRKLHMDTSQDNFTFAVLGDMRWESPPRIAALEYAQSLKPDFMVNLADVTKYGRADEWKKYISELEQYWDQQLPYYHIPGGHSVNARINGLKPAFYKHYFGKTYFRLDAGEYTLLFLDTFLGFFPADELRWLRKQLTETRDRKILLFMHHPPYDKKQGITHALWRNSTDELSELIKEHDVKAIFAAHIHKTFEYEWSGIPVYITSLSETAGHGSPVTLRLVKAGENSIAVSTHNTEVIMK
ncbi:MAG: metallophosphoesterase [Deferribacterales bacterium]